MKTFSTDLNLVSRSSGRIVHDMNAYCNLTSEDEIQHRIYKLLEARPEISQRELADALGISLGRTNYCLKALVRKGLVKMENFRRNGNKLSYAYLLTPTGMSDKIRLTHKFLQRKRAEYDALRTEIQELEQDIGKLNRSPVLAPHPPLTTANKKA
ncbi:MarR family protein [Pigmentiphaga humi]|uniref:MarR family protein n=1 Tax=Pigmentiphaga humi TaxID=2478468 RepID=A0A3P4B1E9_9BURK|nr:MarR family EPS-associated transcriptional regulator [Pigmentiphaga humi]VCU70117.1 MarR family protein [Pigmentiphaga humi]